jgi:hypothetical protein
MLLPLNELNVEVQTVVRKRFDDPVTWFKCSQLRGFLLSNLLLDAVNAAMPARKDITSVDQIKRLTVSLSVDPNSGTPRIVTRVDSIDLKE